MSGRVSRWCGSGTHSRSSWPMLPAPPRPVEWMVWSVIVVMRWLYEAVVEEMRVVRVSIIAITEIGRWRVTRTNCINAGTGSDKHRYRLNQPCDWILFTCNELAVSGSFCYSTWLHVIARVLLLLGCADVNWISSRTHRSCMRDFHASGRTE